MSMQGQQVLPFSQGSVTGKAVLYSIGSDSGRRGAKAGLTTAVAGGPRRA